MSKFFFPFLFSFIIINATAQTWVQKTSLPASGRYTAVAFTISTKAYLGTGIITSTNVDLNDFWEYDPGTDMWTQKANFGGGPRSFAHGFAIGSKGYIGGGRISSTDLWEYDPAFNQWNQKSSLPGGSRSAGSSFAIGTKGYVTTGFNGTTGLKDLWEYDPVLDVWTQKMNFPGTARWDIDRAVFILAGKAYLGTGTDGSVPLNDFWEYDPALNNWAQKADFPGVPRNGATGFSICDKGYLGLGLSQGAYLNDFFIYDPLSNTWTSTLPFTGAARADAPSFVIGNTAYIGTGLTSTIPLTNTNDLWALISSSTKTSSAINACAGEQYLLVATGGATNYTWNTGQTTSSITVAPTSTSTYSVVATGFCSNDTSIFTITVSGQTPNAQITGLDTLCGNQTIQLNASGGTTYLWNTGATSSTITISPTASSNYSVVVSNGGCSDTAYKSITVNLLPESDAGANQTICLGQSTIINGTTSTGTYLWNTGQIAGSFTVTPTSSTAYILFADNLCGTVSDTVTVAVVQVNAVVTGDSILCEGESTILTASGSTGYSWSNGSNHSSISITPLINTSYSVVGTAAGCSDTAYKVVAVHSNPVATIISGQLSIYRGETTTLIAFGAGGGFYVWTSGETTSSITVSPGETSVYCVTATDSNNCQNQACIGVEVKSPCDTTSNYFFPNAFSPNSDGDNDYLKVYYENYDCIKNLKLLIFDRWGEKVFETNNKLFEWHGTYKNKTLNTQVLTYILQVDFSDGNNLTKRGNVSLIK